MPTKAKQGETEGVAMRPRTLREYGGLVLRGFAMGSADVVPGVSGGTMAFILGIYEELIESIRQVARPPFLRALLGGRLVEALRLINAPFLAAIGFGIMAAVLSLAKGLEWLLVHQPVLLWSFFFGLVLASVWAVSKRITVWSSTLLAIVAVATVASFILVGLVPLDTPNDWWFLILSGALAICAMILPGISGAFILLLLGKYQYVLGAVSNLDLFTIAMVGIGAVVGLVSFAQLLGWLFTRYHDATVAALIGLMIGSLRKIWPWKEVVQTITDRHGELIPVVENNVLPTLGGGLLLALALMAVGFAVVLLLERLATPEVKPGT